MDLKSLIAVVSAGVGLFGVGLTVATNLYMLGKFRGAVGERLDGHDEDIADLRKSRGEQWTEINRIDKAVAVQGQKCEMKHGNGHARSHGGFHD